MMRDDKVFEHESYGLISVHRVSGGGPLFGTYVDHHERMEITISEAQHIRTDLHYDRYFPRKRILELQLSPAQFVEFVSTHNSGCGIPCTIRWKDGKSYEHPPDRINLRKRSQEEFEERLEELSKQLDSKIEEVNKLLEKKSALTKDEKQTVRATLGMVRRHLDDTAPFVQKMFDEELDTAVTEAKTQIETATIAAVQRQHAISHHIVETAREQGLLPTQPQQPRLLESNQDGES